MAESANAFSLFHPKVQEWIYKEGWEKLNDAQVKAAYAITKKQNEHTQNQQSHQHLL